MLITWGKVIDIANQKSQFGIWKIVTWKKKLYANPKRQGKAGKTPTAEMSHLIGLFDYSKKWEPVAIHIHMLQVFLPLLLQKPSLKSKNREMREYVKYLNEWMEWWKQGKLEELISECEAIQTRLKKAVKSKKQSDLKAFCALMLQVTRQGCQCCNLSGGVALIVWFTTNGMCVKNNTIHIRGANKQ